MMKRVSAVKLALVFALLLIGGGCPSSGLQEGSDPDDAVASESLRSSAQATIPLGVRVDQMIADSLQNRTLDVTLHGGWQVLHGVLAYGKGFPVRTPDGQREALPYLFEGGELAGFQPLPGDVLEGRRGLRFELEPSSKSGQGHRDQWLAILAQSDLSPETQLTGAGHTMTIMDLVRQAEWDVPLNVEREFSWTLIGLLAYRDTDHRWPARDGNDYNIEGLLQSELRQDLRQSVCGGTHRLNAIAMTLSRRKAEGRPIIGVWHDAQMVIDSAIESARQNQNPDGSYSLSYHHRNGWARDPGEQLGTTGHVVEFLALAAPAETLRQPWVERSVKRIVDLLQQCRSVDLECGVLYHALHGLQEYRTRIPSS